MEHQQIQWTVEFTIEKGKLEEFKKYIKEISDVVKRDEQGTKSYQWYLNDKDETKCIVSESYESSDAALAHLNGNGVKTILVPKIFPIAKITRFEVYGDPSKELQEALTPFGPEKYHFLTGFTS
jgi:quinol monooxygenase YgiN